MKIEGGLVRYRIDGYTDLIRVQRKKLLSRKWETVASFSPASKGKSRYELGDYKEVVGMAVEFLEELKKADKYLRSMK